MYPLLPSFYAREADLAQEVNPRDSCGGANWMHNSTLDWVNLAIGIANTIMGFLRRSF